MSRIWRAKSIGPYIEVLHRHPHIVLGTIIGLHDPHDRAYRNIMDGLLWKLKKAFTVSVREIRGTNL